jgi:hypothetical protein
MNLSKIMTQFDENCVQAECMVSYSVYGHCGTLKLPSPKTIYMYTGLWGLKLESWNDNMTSDLTDVPKIGNYLQGPVVQKKLCP